jgi:hypothetical protein
LPQNQELGNLTAKDLQRSRVDFNTKWSVSDYFAVARNRVVVIFQANRFCLENFYLWKLDVFAFVNSWEDPQQAGPGHLVQDKDL